MIGLCRTSDAFERLNKIGEGTYGRVFRARDKETGDIVALKKIHMHKSNVGFPVTAIREIKILLSLNHPNIIQLKEVLVDKKKVNSRKYRVPDSDSFSHNICTPPLVYNTSDSETSHKYDINTNDYLNFITYLVFEYCEQDLASLIEHIKTPFTRRETKNILYQIVTGIDIIHQNNIIHRDLKLANLFLTKNGQLKIGDFGLAREMSHSSKILTGNVVTMWYRAPELIFGITHYSEAIDMWAIGCIMGELLSGKPLFPGKNEQDQITLISDIIGKPNSKIWPQLESLPKYRDFTFPNNPYNNLSLYFPNETPDCLDLLSRLLICDPNKRITAKECLRHNYFSEYPTPKNPIPMSRKFSDQIKDHHSDQAFITTKTKQKRSLLKKIGTVKKQELL